MARWGWLNSGDDLSITVIATTNKSRRAGSPIAGLTLDEDTHLVLEKAVSQLVSDGSTLAVPNATYGLRTA